MRARFEKLLLVPTTGAPFDITDLVREINIYQSLFDHYMKCDVLLTDAVSISRAIPANEEENINGGLTGGEMLLLQYYSEGNPIISNCFMLYGRSARTKVDDGTDAYLLSGVSPEAFETYPRRISRAYGGTGGNEIHNMVESVVNEFILNNTMKSLYDELSNEFNITVEKTFDWDETSGKHRFVIPNLSVDDTIEFFANESDSKDHIPHYIFYENYYGFHYYNLSTIAQATPVMAYVYSEFNTNIENMDQRKMISYTVKKENNILETARSGLFKSKIINVDVLKKEKIERVFDYQKMFDDFKTLQPYKQKGDSVPDVNVTMMTTRIGHDACECPLFRLENHLPKRINHFLGAKRSYRQHLAHNVLSVMVPGTTFLNAGDTVLLNFPIRDGFTDSKELKLDKELSGKYIITKVRNKFNELLTKGTFVTVFECIKDTQIQES